MASWVSKTAAVWKYRSGKRYILDNTRSKTLLGLKYTPFDETIRDCARDAIRLGFIEDKTNSTIDK